MYLGLTIWWLMISQLQHSSRFLSFLPFFFFFFLYTFYIPFLIPFYCFFTNDYYLLLLASYFLLYIISCGKGNMGTATGVIPLGVFFFFFFGVIWIVLD